MYPPLFCLLTPHPYTHTHTHTHTHHSPQVAKAHEDLHQFGKDADADICALREQNKKQLEKEQLEQSRLSRALAASEKSAHLSTEHFAGGGRGGSPPSARKTQVREQCIPQLLAVD